MRKRLFATTLSVLGAALCFMFAAAPLSATVAITLLSPGGTSKPVGTAVQWTASNAFNNGEALQYRWVITQNGSTVVFRDFNTTATISYAPIREGSYTVTVTGRNPANVNDTDTVSATYSANSLLPAQHAASLLLASSASPTVAATSNPLVAIYRATCASGTMRVFFAPAGTSITSGFATPSQTCGGATALSFLIAGMRANTTYSLQHQVQSGFTFTAGPTLSFTTGSVPASALAVLPAMTVSGTPSAGQPVILESALIPHIVPAAYDTSGHLIWYIYPSTSSVFRPVNGGTVLVAASAPGQSGNVFAELDLLGNVIHETNIVIMGEQLAALGVIHPSNPTTPSRLADFNHDAVRLPSGDTVVIGLIEQGNTSQAGGPPGDVIGDAVMVLDRNFQLVWAWSTFGHININRKATLGDTCVTFTNGCPILDYLRSGQVAADWIHANSIWYTGDGDLLLSMRSQDQLVKINYQNATGTANGQVLWLMGNGGNFTLAPGQTWFSHQHNATLNGTTLSLFDNANATHNLYGDSSRGLVITVNEAAKTADITTEAIMGCYSSAIGTAQILLSGNTWFLCGIPAADASQAIEFRQGTGMVSPVFHVNTNNNNYRSIRMKDLYTP